MAGFERWRLARGPRIPTHVRRSFCISTAATEHRRASMRKRLRSWTRVSMFPAARRRSSEGRYSTARARYAEAYPELFANAVAEVQRQLTLCGDRACARAAAHRRKRAGQGATRSQRSLSPNNSAHGPIGLRDLGRADPRLARREGQALAALREAERAGWRWTGATTATTTRHLASIRNEPEFKAIFADIERDMAQQRAASPRAPRMPRWT